MEKISVNTPIGVLTACVGGDPECYPEIFIRKRRKTPRFSCGECQTWTENDINIEIN